MLVRSHWGILDILMFVEIDGSHMCLFQFAALMEELLFVGSSKIPSDDLGTVHMFT